MGCTEEGRVCSKVGQGIAGKAFKSFPNTSADPDRLSHSAMHCVSDMVPNCSALAWFMQYFSWAATALGASHTARA